MRSSVYHTRPQTWNLDRAKAPGFNDRSNIDPFTIVESRELSRWSKSKFVAEYGIFYFRELLRVNRLFTALLLLLLSPFQSLKADCEYSLEVRSAFFFHSSGLFRDIYGTTNGSYSIELGVKRDFCPELWGNLDVTSQDGKSVGAGDPTDVTIVNGSVGIKIPFGLTPWLVAYAGFGPSLSYIHLDNKLPYGREDASRCVVGWVLKFGFNHSIAPGIFLDVFLDYLYQPAGFETIVDIGGFKPGIGIGVTF